MTSLNLDYIDALRLHLKLTELFHFDQRINGLSYKEETFLMLCMHIKILGYPFQSEEAFMLMNRNNYKNSKYLYWNDRILPKGWFTGKLFRDKGNADLTPLLGIQLGKPLSKIRYNLEITLKSNENGEGSFFGLP